VLRHALRRETFRANALKLKQLLLIAKCDKIQLYQFVNQIQILIYLKLRCAFRYLSEIPVAIYIISAKSAKGTSYLCILIV